MTVALTLDVKAVKIVCNVGSSLDRADLHIDRRAHVDSFKIFLDKFRNQRRGGRNRLQSKFALHVVGEIADSVEKSTRLTVLAVTVGIE